MIMNIPLYTCTILTPIAGHLVFFLTFSYSKQHWDEHPHIHVLAILFIYLPEVEPLTINYASAESS